MSPSTAPGTTDLPSTRRRVLRLPTRIALRARHAVRLLRDLVVYSGEQRIWWLVPVVVLLLVLALTVTATHTVVPVAVYTLF